MPTPQEEHKQIRKELNNSGEYIMLCRLCAYECLKGYANALESNLQQLIAKYLFIEITSNAEQPQTIICLSCLQHLQDFDEFFRTVKERQKVLHELGENIVVTPKLEISELFSNLENSPSPSIADNLEFSYAACDEDEFDEAFKDEEDVLLLAEPETKIPKEKNKKKKTTIARRKLKRKNSKEGIQIKVDKPKKQAKNILSPEEEKQKDELVAKSIPLHCEICQMKSESYKEFQSHFQKVHKQKAYIRCCGKRLNKRSLILSHIQFHMNPDLYKCDLCNKSLKSKVSLDNHKKIFHNRTQLAHKCPECGKMFAYPSMLDKHLAVHKDERSYACEICQKRFKLEFALKYHIKNMHGERTGHICDICGKEYRFKLSFDQHVAEHKGTFIGKKKQCSTCNLWVAASYYKRHVQRHEKVDVKCDVCGQTFNSIPCLNSHKERNHKKLKNYNCPYCEKIFVRARYLKEHIDVHTGHKEYSCKYCPREFRSKANMYAHTKKMHHALWAQAQLDRTQNPYDQKPIVKNETEVASATSH